MTLIVSKLKLFCRRNQIDWNTSTMKQTPSITELSISAILIPEQNVGWKVTPPSSLFVCVTDRTR
jgi:hypothetical protein